MANKKDSNGAILTGIGIVAFLIIKGIMLALALIPIFFLIYGIACYFLFRGEKDQALIGRKFWLTKSEQKSYIDIYNAFDFFRNKRDRAWEAVSQENIRLNKDGSISQRSYRGQDLQGAIRESEEKIKQYEPRLEELKKLPRKNWKRVRRHFINRIAMPAALFSGLIVMAFNIGEGKTQTMEVVTDTQVSTDAVSSEKGTLQKIVSFYSRHLTTEGFVAIGATWTLCWIFMNITYNKQFPEPKEVSIYNVTSK